MPRHIPASSDEDRIEGSSLRRRKRPEPAPKSLSARLQARIGKSSALAKRAHSAPTATRAFDARQRVIVKIHYFNHAGGGGKALKSHGLYVARDAASRDGAEVPPSQIVSSERELEAHARYLDRGRGRNIDVFYDAQSEQFDARAQLKLWAKEDRRHFRLVLSAEQGARLRDLQDYTRAVMARVETALNTKLEWVAVNHWDTDNPHTHIILRGRLSDGRDLVIPRQYVSHGFREAAREIATERLGARTRDDERRALEHETRAHRPSRLDGLIEQQLDDKGRIRAAHLEAHNPDIENALKARVRTLEGLGLAQEVQRNVFVFEPDWRDTLRQMELHLDIRKARMRERALDKTRAGKPKSRLLDIDR